MLKVTDICSTDPSKPNSCSQPGDIKVDRTKVKIWSGSGNDPREAKDIPGLDGDAWHSPTIWFFRYCWDDVSPIGFVQPSLSLVATLIKEEMEQGLLRLLLLALADENRA